ncbi:MAG TPA: ATP-binding protein [Candidatus Bathyarchaeia archaeon]|jgi:two-component system sensor histidine kinase KdpD|nr:ATP-binding protein [Candidatus Bathyarchaeia archaeon]
MTFSKRPFFGYIASVVAVASVWFAFWPIYDEIRAGTAISVLLLLVLVIATTFGTGPALAASILSAICLNFFFVLPPLKLQLAGGWNLSTLVTFSIVSTVVGQLSARLKERAVEVQQLYNRLRETFEQFTKIEALKQSEQLKSALLDAVTHDLRTPLTSIKAAATALMKSRNGRESLSALEPTAERDFLQMIVDQADRLNHFIEAMLELAKVQAGNFSERASTDSVEEIINAALARAEKMLSYHQVRCVCPEGLMMSCVNPKAVAQAIFSLVENASRHAPRGTEITITTERLETDEVRVTIEDEGPGIPPQYRQQVFEKFFQLPGEESASMNNGAGLGLGLAIARGIIEAHGGKIWIEGRKDGLPGTGVVFTLKGSGDAKSEHQPISGPATEL